MAIAANIGILNSADDDSIDNLPAAVPSSTAVEPQVIDVFLEEPTPAVVVAPTSTSLPDDDSSRIQEFAIEDAGTVSIERTDAGLSIVEVDAADGWETSNDDSSADSVRVTFARGEVNYLFVATVGADGSIVTSVEQPIVEIVRIPAPPSPQGAPGGAAPTVPPVASSPSMSVPAPVVSTDDGHDDEDEDEHDDEHDDEDEHEDENEDEYEGADDDD